MSHFRNPEGISHIQGMDVLYLGHVIQRLAKSQYLMEPQEYDADSRPFLEDLLMGYPVPSFWMAQGPKGLLRVNQDTARWLTAIRKAFLEKGLYACLAHDQSILVLDKEGSERFLTAVPLDVIMNTVQFMDWAKTQDKKTVKFAEQIAHVACGSSGGAMIVVYKMDETGIED